MKVCLFPGERPYPSRPSLFAAAASGVPGVWKRPFAVAAAAVLASALHGLLLLWYLNRPAPPPLTEALPLPTIDLVLSAPPSIAQPAPTPPEHTVQPDPPPRPKPKPPVPREVKKPEPKPVKKPIPKPKPVRQESVAKPAETRKPEESSDPPPVPAASPERTQARSSPAQAEKYTPARTHANYLSNPAPVYPAQARSRHWEGLVMLRVYVTPEGRCGEVAVARSSGHETLDDSALDAVRKWRFVPAKRGEEAVASWATVPIEFKLE